MLGRTRRQPPTSVIIAGVVALALTTASSQAARRLGIGVAQPTNYVSPSGAYALFVDPADRYGRGAATYRLSKNGVEVWSGERPYALREVSVTDDGLAAGMAYRQSPRDENDNRSPDRFMHIVILGSNGREILNEVKQRQDAPYTHGPTLPELAQFVVDAANDRIIARVRVRRSEWWVYRLSTGESTARVDPKAWMPDFPNVQYVVDARLLPGTPLILVHWYTKSPDHKVKDAGAVFALVDPEEGPVWSFKAKEDYATIEFGWRRYGGGTQSYFEKHPAIVGATPGGRFDLRLFAENKQASFVARRGDDGAWVVTELGRIDILDAEQPESATSDKTCQSTHVSWRNEAGIERS